MASQYNITNEDTNDSPADSMRRYLSHVYLQVINSPIVWILPAAAFLSLFQLYPLVEAVRVSLTNLSLISPETSYIGLENYVQLLTSNRLLPSFVTTLLYAGGNLVTQITLGLLLALVIEYGMRNKISGGLLTRVAVMSAWVVPGVIVGLVWKIMLLGTEYGFINAILTGLGLEAVTFLSDPTVALISVITADVWRGTAFSMILFYAALKRVPEDLHRASEVDGAHTIDKYRYVILPQIKPMAFIVTILVSINSFNSFDLILALTEGGPGSATSVLALFMYQEAFSAFDVGLASAVAVVLLLITLSLATVYIRLYDISEAI